MNTVTAVRREIVVPAPIDEAFAAFVERFDEIKPHEHNLLDSPIAATEFEPRVGGHIIDRGVDGSECRWSRVLAYEPPTRLVFSWDIGPTWDLVDDPSRAAEVEVRFIAESPTSTRVELEHRNLDHHGTDWHHVSDGVADDGGWTLYLQRFHDVVATT